jgi:acetolactate synthase-1/2/3 large subunit
MKTRVVDYVAQRIVDLGVEHVFTLTGGGAMFLNDGVAKHPQLQAICNHHEQASSMAGVGYGKYSGKMGVVMPTTGCGSTNAITGLLEAWQDNLPTFFISGQVNKEQATHNIDLPLRQLGVQEANIIEIVKSLTKYAVMINDPEMIAYHIDKAIYEAQSGRPGPVWLDIPMDVQGALIEPDKLKRFIPEKESYVPAVEDLAAVSHHLAMAERPVILAGNGIRLAGAQQIFSEFVEQHNIPVVNTFLAADILPSDNPLNIGRVGIKGNRAANFVMQNADVILAIGTRLGVPVTGYRYELFGREAKLIVVDIDKFEHQKNTVHIDHLIVADAKEFLKKAGFPPSPDAWTQKCLGWKKRWPIFLPEHFENDEDGISLYAFMKVLSDCMRPDDVVVADAGSAFYVTSQALQVTDNQRYITSGGQADMGFTLPASIGVCIARGKKDVIGITGDGSFQTNIQELQTIVYNKLPIKIFVWNNNGYLSIRTTQRKFFEDRFIGTDEDSGVSFPNFRKIANAYGIKYFRTSKTKGLKQSIKRVLQYKGPVICEVMCKKWDAILPTIGSKKLPDGRLISRPLEDMYPFLDREEFYENMVVTPIKEE